LTEASAGSSFPPAPGERRNDARDQTQRAALLAALLPGAGHFVLHAHVRGAIFLVVVTVLLAAGGSKAIRALGELTDRVSVLEPPGAAVTHPFEAAISGLALLVAAAFVHLVSVFDAIRIARRKASGRPRSGTG